MSPVTEENIKRRILVAVNFEDSCVFIMHGVKFEPGWEINFNKGFLLKCPHGIEVSVSVEQIKDADNNS